MANDNKYQSLIDDIANAIGDLSELREACETLMTELEDYQFILEDFDEEQDLPPGDLDLDGNAYTWVTSGIDLQDTFGPEDE